MLDALLAWQPMGTMTPYGYENKRQPQTHFSWSVKGAWKTDNTILSFYHGRQDSITALSYAQQYVNRYSSLEDDWDGYGGFAPTQLVLNNAIRLLGSLPLGYLQRLDPNDDITPNPNGTISIEWVNENDKVFVEVGNSTMNMFKKFNGNYHTCDNLDINDNRILVNSIREILRF